MVSFWDLRLCTKEVSYVAFEELLCRSGWNTARVRVLLASVLLWAINCVIRVRFREYSFKVAMQ